jgi:hypothetical protein
MGATGDGSAERAVPFLDLSPFGDLTPDSTDWPTVCPITERLAPHDCPLYWRAETDLIMRVAWHARPI